MESRRRSRHLCSGCQQRLGKLCLEANESLSEPLQASLSSGREASTRLLPSAFGFERRQIPAGRFEIPRRGW